MEETSLEVKIKPEIESSEDNSSIGSDIVCSMTELPLPDVVLQGDDEPVHALTEDPVGQPCHLQVQKRKKKASIITCPDFLKKEEDEVPDNLLDESYFLNTVDEPQTCTQEAAAVAPRKRGRKKKVHVSPPPEAASKAQPHCRFCTTHATTSKRGRKRGRPPSRSMKCKLCSMVLPDASHLRKHERAHNANHRFKCQYCIKTFPALCNVKEHERMHTGERPFCCQFCNKGFTTGGAVKVHERTHTGERPFQCKLCKKNFATSGVLRAHVRYHTGERPYKCKICPKAFAESGHLRRHERIHADVKNLHLHKDMYFVL